MILGHLYFYPQTNHSYGDRSGQGGERLARFVGRSEQSHRGPGALGFAVGKCSQGSVG